MNPIDPILYWNAVALEANRVSHTNGAGEQTGPTLSSRALAIVHLAMYDALEGSVLAAGASTPYLQIAVTASDAGSSTDAAVAAAAHATLSALFPSQKAFFDLQHGKAPLTGLRPQDGANLGARIGAAMLKDRKGDPDAKDNGYASQLHHGAHRPDPEDHGQGYHAPFYGERSKCFAVTARHGLSAPPDFSDPDYTRALKQVRGKGIAPELMGTLPSAYKKRTVDETLIGIYWGYDGPPDLGTPPRLYNQIVREVADKQGNTPRLNAKLFAMVNAAMGDAGILAWEQKYNHNLWRPVVGIREHDPSMGAIGAATSNIDEDCDTTWLPLGKPSSNADTVKQPAAKNGTPPFPAYPSGHATFGAAAFQIVRRFYGQGAGIGPDTLFSGQHFVSDECNGVTRDNKGNVRPRHRRSFDQGLWQMIVENGLSRVYLGVHWAFDAFLLNAQNQPDIGRSITENIGGVPLGLKIANDIFDSGLVKSTVPPSV